MSTEAAPDNPTLSAHQQILGRLMETTQAFTTEYGRQFTNGNQELYPFEPARILAFENGAAALDALAKARRLMAEFFRGV